ncbi:YjiH family protein [Staphylococcus equorum]|uniref:Histidine transporter n=1 Tax=Staphylococcus equorum TaxID=246432 RepID=A0AAP7LTV5_9STAP|nr:YjiH family protein [Staphylococcus equorum]MDK9864082.1 YjiH family protein [Staphylococcus equorum]OEK53514.1 histidine transporter [Staphylococcus equorum]OEK56816.1 histidine transporter [Staphylococcus equorum]OEK61471.1 histidine transporter [Staphylococcus equorum]OEK64268.1 histidine transporter [Staphylococcus equorum]
MSKTLRESKVKSGNQLNAIKFFVYSLIGIVIFFVPVTINNNSSILLDHFVTWISSALPLLTKIFIMIIIILGAIYPFIKGTWNRNTIETIFTLFKVLGVIIGILLIFNIGPSWLLNEQTGMYVFNYLVIPVGLTVPAGGAVLALLVGYGLLEFVGVYAQKIMYPIWKTPGRSAVNALASFVASFAVGLLITNKEYKEGKFTQKQAVIIATGFSTVTVAFMIVIAKTLHLMDIWNLYFWTTLFVTAAVTACTVRIWPISKISNTYYDHPFIEEDTSELKGKEKLRFAWKKAMDTVESSPDVMKNIWLNFKESLIMTMNILPTILSIGLICLLLAEYTVIFDYLAYVFYPLTWILQIPDSFLAAKGAAIGITEMFLPSLIVVEAPLITKFIIAVTSVSTIIFFSASVPSILSTDIPIRIRDLVVIWFERTVLSLIIVTPIAYVFL